MPNLNDVERGLKIGKNNNNLFTYKNCEQCKQPRWIQLNAPNKICIPCQCANMRNKLVIGYNTPPEPNTQFKEGDIARGKYIGKHPTQLYRLDACIDCGKLRWVDLSVKGRLKTQSSQEYNTFMPYLSSILLRYLVFFFI